MIDPAVLAAVARRLGLSAGQPQIQYPGMSMAQALDTSLSPRTQRLPLLPRPVTKGIAGTPM